MEHLLLDSGTVLLDHVGNVVAGQVSVAVRQTPDSDQVPEIMDNTRVRDVEAAVRYAEPIFGTGLIS